MLCYVILLLIASAGRATDDKGYVVDGALKVTSERLMGKEFPLPLALGSFNQKFNLVRVLFQLVLSESKLRVEELSRRGAISYSEWASVASFRYHALLKARLDSNYVIYGGETSVVSSGKAVIYWDLGFNSTFVTRSCNLGIESAPMFESYSFHINLYSEDKRMNVSYEHDPFNTITSVLMQNVTVLLERSLGDISICKAIKC